MIVPRSIRVDTINSYHLRVEVATVRSAKQVSELINSSGSLFTVLVIEQFT